MSQPSRRPQTDFDPQRFELLLQACFLRGPNAVAAFEQWNSYNDWDDGFNTDEFRLFPQLYRNLVAQNFDHPLMAKFRGIARKAWYNNNLLFHRLASTLKELRDGGIPILVLGGAAFALRDYKDHVLSPSPGVGLFIHPHDARATFATLRQGGWQSRPDLPANDIDAFFATRYFTYWQHPNGDRLFLQWQLLPDCPTKTNDSTFWERAQEISVDGVPALVLDPTDQLLLSCSLGSLPLGAPRPQRSSDVLLLLSAASEEINWDQFLAHLQTQHIVFPAREILPPLAATFNTLIPASVIEKLVALPISSDEQKSRILWDAVTPNERAQQLWRIYERRSCNSNAASFPSFLQHWWGLDSIVQLPRHALSSARRSGLVGK